MSPTREKYPLSENKIVKKTITSVLGTTVFLGFFGVAFAFPFVGILTSIGTSASSSVYDIFSKLIWLYPLFFLFYIAIVYFYQRMYFASYYYEIGVDYLVIKKGVFAPHEITIPWERIQDVYVDQDIWDRLFGLYDVHLSTATETSGISAHIDGVEQPAADGLKALFLDKVKTRISQPQNRPI